jgi:hypothetical protein
MAYKTNALEADGEAVWSCSPAFFSVAKNARNPRPARTSAISVNQDNARPKPTGPNRPYFMVSGFCPAANAKFFSYPPKVANKTKSWRTGNFIEITRRKSE